MVNKKINVCSDLHGRREWSKIPNDNTLLALGDYFDSFDISFEDQRDNFLDIMQYKKDNPEVILLLGNHDSPNYLHQSCSGYQRIYAAEIKKLLTDNANQFQMAYSLGNTLFTHAGVTKTWCEGFDIDHTKKDIADQINQLWLDNPLAFVFQQAYSMRTDSYGDDVFQGPAWVRPHSLMLDAVDEWKQVVGHTRKDNIEVIRDKFYFTDNLENGGNQYLETDGIDHFVIKNIE